MLEDRINRFQFLIGRLKTASGVSDIPVPAAFQFLIGRLKTSPPEAGKAFSAGFNSL